MQTWYRTHTQATLSSHSYKVLVMCLHTFSAVVGCKNLVFTVIKNKQTYTISVRWHMKVHALSSFFFRQSRTLQLLAKPLPYLR